MPASPDFDIPEQLVQSFLNNPAGQGEARGVIVQMTYPQLVALVRTAYRVGAKEERERRAMVNPFAAPLGETDSTRVNSEEPGRFSNLEFREREPTL